MGISIRLEKSIEDSLRKRLQFEGISLSDFIRDAIREKLASYDNQLSPYELGKDLFGRYSSGRDDLSTNRKTLLREKLHAKYRR